MVSLVVANDGGVVLCEPPDDVLGERPVSLAHALTKVVQGDLDAPWPPRRGHDCFQVRWHQRVGLRGVREDGGAHFKEGRGRLVGGLEERLRVDADEHHAKQ